MKFIDKDIGFVLKRWNFRESSLMASIYTRKWGRIVGLFKGFYTNKKEFTSSLDILTLNEFILYPRRREVWLVSYADLIGESRFLHQNFFKAKIAALFAEIVYRTSGLHHSNPKVFFLLKNFLHTLEVLPEDEKVAYFFLIKFLTVSGFRPEFTHCIVCNGSCGQRAFFSISRGGLICRKCYSSSEESISLSKETVSVINYAQKHGGDHLFRLKISSKGEEELKFILKTFLEYHLEFSLSLF